MKKPWKRSKEWYAKIKKNRGTLNNGQPVHSTTNPRLHLERTRKTIQKYFDANPKMRMAGYRREEKLRHAKNTFIKSGTRTRDQDAGSRPQVVQGADHQSAETPENA